ncbi:GrpE protein HSP-70 cofactor [Candidatus Nitrosoglobus terrae]|uniref:Protein GrpE n=1 Tax=Candidatus Nitrosoglobus terrae TaxID=1630141 RepID=A0A1Q2SKS5_9GAMM|nr:nucleotide exchange factor GrpE [Candidatus Nitrosoglobus terrae]BAW79751.1 GrpE protein HSP-70 cofactor [Candidatus Nitrosoglobus terrae]
MTHEEKITSESDIAAEQSQIAIDPQIQTEDGETQDKESKVAEIENMQQLLEEARSKIDEHWNELLRSRAELENQRRRYDRELEKARKYALEKFAQELLPVKDSLEMGLIEAQVENVSVATLREGTELILKEFNKVTDQFGIRAIDPQEELFNPELHQAISAQENDEIAPNTILTVIRKGYVLNDRLLRPAMVIVSKPSTRSLSEEDA